MLRHLLYIKFVVALTSVTLLAGAALAQSPATRDSERKEVAAGPAYRSSNSGAGPSDAKPGRPENSVSTEEPRPIDLKSEVEILKAENAAVRELLLKMAEQQKALLDQVDRLQRRLDGGAIPNVSADAHPTGKPQSPSQKVQPTDQSQSPFETTALSTTGAEAPAENAAHGPVQPADAANASAPQTPGGKQEKEDRYQDGIIIYQNSDDARVPFLLKFNNNTQVRYLNTTSSPETFTDHLGVVREVHNRNDITVNRSMFILAGYMFDPKLQYSLTVWTSAGAASIVVAGNIGWRFNKALTITGGYTGVPGSRSLVNTFPFFQPIDRSMADNFFRPGFTQGVWANGEMLKGLNYLAFVGNGLNTLN
ncbi:MAG TPA: hypothetical protein VFV34_27100, partial [Blastocatellia bacterium]|nr:hypothetical protein [Blastocatellia bacterium]